MSDRFEYDEVLHELPDNGGAYVIFRGISRKNLERAA